MDQHGRAGSGPLSLTEWIDGLGRMTSLCQAHGHIEARRYPVPMLWKETRLVRERVNRDLANSAILTQMAIASVLTKEGGKAFNKHMRSLTET